MTAPAPHDDLLVRAARFVGDFGHPFYAEERQRDVWNEASAFGLQLLLWLVVLGATATVWLVGAPALPYVAGALGIVGLTCLLTILYAARLGVTVAAGHRVLRARLVPYGALVLALGAGCARAEGSDLGWSFGGGVLSGAAVAVVVGVLAARRRPAPAED